MVTLTRLNAKASMRGSLHCAKPIGGRNNKNASKWNIFLRSKVPPTGKKVMTPRPRASTRAMNTIMPMSFYSISIITLIKMSKRAYGYNVKLVKAIPAVSEIVLTIRNEREMPVLAIAYAISVQ